jgi:protein tyrosine phosphatase (PTP) superfamily phosphohydrolase (DUF442 family)
VLLPSTAPSAPAGVAQIPPTSPYAQKPSAYLGDPDLSAAAPAADEPKPSAQQEPAAKLAPTPPMIEEGTSSPFPVGIANFSEVKDDVSTGLRPNHLDGFNWLQTKGYKTIVFLRDGKEDDSSDRKQIENRGLKYVSLTVTPETINSELVAEFNRLVNDAAGRPIFIYDSNGSRSGTMWYLYFRTSEMSSNDEAVVRARRHGLKQKGSDEQTQLMTAVQKFLAQQKK